MDEDRPFKHTPDRALIEAFVGSCDLNSHLMFNTQARKNEQLMSHELITRGYSVDPDSLRAKL